MVVRRCLCMLAFIEPCVHGERDASALHQLLPVRGIAHELRSPLYGTLWLPGLMVSSHALTLGLRDPPLIAVVEYWESTTGVRYRSGFSRVSAIYKVSAVAACNEQETTLGPDSGFSSSLPPAKRFARSAL